MMLWKNYVNCVFCFIWILSCVMGLFTPVVKISQGKLRGLSLSGLNRFYGVPYATAHRFQAPKDSPTWRGIFNAINRFGSCAQTVSLLTLGSEDCLQLDVYTPDNVTPRHRLPVLVFIHGGAYYYGSKAHYDPEYLVAKGVVTVILNYRVGVLGFLCLNGVANLGLKDQQAALRWIRKNISAFGGDPDNVTLSGQSAGASAAGMHFLSLSSKGLFHKAILMSGTPLSPWAFNMEPLKPAFEDAAKLGVAENEKDVYDIFSNATVKDLLHATHDTSTNSRYFKYSPCGDSHLPDPFFYDAPYNIIKSGNFHKVPLMIGFTDVEGMLFYGLNSERTLREWNHLFMERLPSIFSWCSEEDKRKMSNVIRKYYFGNENITGYAIKGIVDYYSDWIAYGSIHAFSNLMTSVSEKPVYNYMFSYEGGRNFAKYLFGRGTGLKGASHSDDIFYIFKPVGLPLTLTHDDDLFINRLTTMITNFMKYGDPTPSSGPLLAVRWRAAAPNSSLMMHLDRQLWLSETPASHRGQFFHGMLCKHGRSGYVPCDSAAHCDAEPT